MLVNYHMGNTVLATPAVSALIDALPMAEFSFVGIRQRKGKSWDISNFGVVAKGLRSHGFPVVVFIGYEEASREELIRASLGQALYIKEPDIRRVAALVSGCRAVFTPDSGPMHLSIAVRTKTVALFVKPNLIAMVHANHKGRWSLTPSEH